MKKIIIDKKKLDGGIKTEGNGFLFPAEGGEILIPELITAEEKYFVFTAECKADHSSVFELRFYAKNEKIPRFTFRFGLLPEIKVRIFFDFDLLNAGILFPGNMPGQLKTVCHGSRIEKNEIERAVLASRPCFKSVNLALDDLILTDEFPNASDLPGKKLVDKFGQNKLKDWKGKIKSEDELKEKLNRIYKTPLEKNQNLSKYCGNKKNKLTSGTGFFSTVKQNGRWYLTDPEGYAFFSMGPDCINPMNAGRIDGMENFFDWMPEKESPEYKNFVTEGKSFQGQQGKNNRENIKMISFSGINLYRVFGDNWYEAWCALMEKTVLFNSMNTIANWSDPGLSCKIKIPYVRPMQGFPGTTKFIFRDFPDVLSLEYAENSKKWAEEMPWEKDDPWMIGYFLRNEPAWAFVDNIIMADEVFRYPEKTFCKAELIKKLKTKYGDVSKLNEAYNMSFNSFDELEKPVPSVSSFSAKAKEDMLEFSRILIRAYTEIPAKACKKSDPNHLILGMRWAWISNPDLAAGWENFDVFSINCYEKSPAAAIENVCKLGVDLPVIIGEFHFGALDAGPTATGLSGVKSQHDRGLAYRYYCEQAASHPNGAGCHYFQMYDQAALGRFDGENYNIGFLDVCSLPYEEMMEQVKICSENIYDIMDGKQKPADVEAETIPMIAY